MRGTRENFYFTKILETNTRQASLLFHYLHLNANADLFAEMFEYFKSEVDNRSNFLKIPKNTSYDGYIISHRAKEITKKKK